MAPQARRIPGLPEPGCERPDLSVLLPLLPELEPARQRTVHEHAQRCVECGSKLELLHETDRWLERQVRRSPPGVCPPPEQLYDFGGGPGAGQLSDAERLSVGAHVADCDDCGTLVATLEQRPPSPLLLEGEERPKSPPRVLIFRRRLAILAPLAAAAAVLAVMVWNGGAVRNPSAIRFPVDPQLRGTASGDLWFPRERLLATPDGLWSTLWFEIAPQASATSYRVVVERNGGGAFDSGEEVGNFIESRPLFEGSLELTPGHYTWEAWATVEGLEVSLGSRDFEVVEDSTMLGRIGEPEGTSEPARSEEILHLLHSSGFTSDARAFARMLPQSPERDEYLSRPPAR